jgi:lipopolysaccharide/colanic/teichoic acid biosynthesis glycosyltransferase
LQSFTSISDHVDFLDKENDKKVFNETDFKVAEFLSHYLDEKTAGKIHWINSECLMDINVYYQEITGIGNQLHLNDIPCLDTYLRDLNAALDIGQLIVVCLETKNSRKERLFGSLPAIIRIPYYTADFLITRVLPKLWFTRKLYTWITKDKRKVITLTEGLARLVYTGFKIKNFKKIDGITYVVAIKEGVPNDDCKPSSGALIKLNRVGKGGFIHGFYKLRTMHPYSEFLQEYVFEKYGTVNGDKVEEDFRVTSWGIIFRKYWIDELPMLWNLVKGEVKLVGVRPLSQHKFDQYPDHLKKKRIKTKPGMIPPFYAEIPQTQEDFFEVENAYLESYFKHPVRTDIRYFLKAVYNIVIKGQRSR